MTYKIGSKIKLIGGFPAPYFWGKIEFARKLEEAEKEWNKNSHNYNSYLVLNRSSKKIINPTVKEYINGFYIIEFEAIAINGSKFHLICHETEISTKHNINSALHTWLKER